MHPAPRSRLEGLSDVPPAGMPRPFLTARWESLLLLNYVCPADLLIPLVPTGTQLDTWNGQLLVSLVGFLFADARVRGVPIPFHRRFEEVNLRFYVRRTLTDDTIRRAVVFIREFVPRSAIAAVARWAYNEPYVAVPMRHRRTLTREDGGEVEYTWCHRNTDFSLGGRATGPARPVQPDSQAEFITEHYWGYTRQRDGSTLEYQVEHPSWDVWEATESHFRGPGQQLYGPGFGTVLAGPPRSAHLAVGSAVAVHPGRRL